MLSFLRGLFSGTVEEVEQGVTYPNTLTTARQLGWYKPGAQCSGDTGSPFVTYLKGQGLFVFHQEPELVLG